MLAHQRNAPNPFLFKTNPWLRRLIAGWLFIIVVLSTACSTTASNHPQLPAQKNDETARASEPEITATPLSSATEQHLPTATVSAKASLPNCLAQRGRVEQSILIDQRLFRDLPYRVYLPPCYGENPKESFPTLYLLHGLQSTDSQWDDLGIDEAANTLISSGSLPPFIIVMPWHRTGIDLTRAVPEILVPHIEANYASQTVRTFRAIGGLSKGGGQALEIGLKYPEVFSAVGMHSPAVQYLDTVIIDWALEIPTNLQPALWIDIGRRDSLYPAADSLITELQRNAIPITMQINNGDHLAEYWQSHLEGYLRWYGSNWQRASWKNTIE